MRPDTILAIALLAFATASAEDSAPSLAEIQIFVTTDCPIANAYAPEIVRLHETYSPQGVEFRLVYPEPTLTEEEVASHLEEYGLTPEAIIDLDHELVKAAGATTTPEAAVYDAAGKLVYRGRIDDLYSDLGDRRRVASKHYLRDVIDSIVSGRKVEFSQTTPIGCLIEPLAAGD